MIEVRVSIPTGQGDHEIALIKMSRVSMTPDRQHGDYHILFGVETGEGIAVYQRHVDNFPRTQYNVLGLLRIALETLEQKELSLDRDPDNAGYSPDLARRLERALRQV
jgi:hypothetical protein